MVEANVSGLTIVGLIFSAILCFLVPVVLFLFIRKRANKLGMPIIAGVVSFFVMQIVIRIPILTLIQTLVDFNQVNIWVLALSLGFSAALFETAGRVMSMAWIIRKDRRFSAGFAHGIGHGGIEAIMLVGINYVVYIIFAILINTGNAELGQSVDAVKDVLINTDSSLFYVAGFERMVTIIIHIGLSVLTMFAFKTNRKIYILYVLFIHTLLDFSVVILGHYGLSIILIELYVVLYAVVLGFIMKNIYNKYKVLKQEEEVQND